MTTAILLSWTLMLVPLTPSWFDSPVKSWFHIAGFTLLVITAAVSTLDSQRPKIRPRQIAAIVGLSAMFLSHSGLADNTMLYLAVAPFIALVMPYRQTGQAAVAILALALPMVLLQGIQEGYVVYENSDKATLLFWNPNTFWHHASALGALAIATKSNRWAVLTAAYALGGLIFGFSRGAALIFGLAALFAAARHRPRALSALRLISILLIVAIALMPLINMEGINYLFDDYDQLVSGRFTSAFGKPEKDDIAAGIGYATDMPILDIMLWGYSPLFIAGLILLAWAVHPRTEALLIIILAFTVDSALYAPVISVALLIFVSITAASSVQRPVAPPTRPPCTALPRSTAT